MSAVVGRAPAAGRVTDAAASITDPRVRAPWLVPRVAAGTAFTVVVVVVAALAAWPIYRSWTYLLLVAVGALLAGAIATVARWRRWNAAMVGGTLAVTMLLVGVPLAVPSRLGGLPDLLRGLVELGNGVVFGWKDLVTVELPVGSYRNLLVPALVVFLIGTCVVLLLSWRQERWAYAAVPVALGMMTFGLFFGRTSVSAPWVLGAVVIRAPVETAIGIAGLLTCVLWLAWRTHDERMRALQRAAASSGVRISRRTTPADRRRIALGAGMLGAAFAISAAVVPFAAQGADREVLRSAVGPDIDLSAEASPLSEYRSLFTDERAGSVLFTVGPAGEDLPERVRIATLDAYDGEVFRSGGEGAADAGRFVRVPSNLDAGAGSEVAVRVAIEDWDEIWMPTAGRLEDVEFAGDRTASLDDSFYYNAAASAGVQTVGGGLAEGDVYTARGIEPDVPALEDIDPPGTADGTPVPESLRAWMDENGTGSGGAGLAGMVTLLRERGYLSHGLTEGETTPQWALSLTDYTFQPSASGHSLARIDTMFTRLLERESDPRAEASGNYVAAIGDDEQFAVAVALMARELGFPSRVVLGARLSSADPGLAVCEEGRCRAQDLAAWTEVQSAEGDWVAIDVTPQHAQSPSLDVTEQRDPENVTEVRPDTVEEVVPPDPTQEDSASDHEDATDAGLDLAWLGPVLRSGAIALVVLVLAFGPFLAIVWMKAVRRRHRRRGGAPQDRIAGGWEEYVDAALDQGWPAPPALTRTELAAAFATPAGAQLARDADRAVFSHTGLTPEEAERYWSVVDGERRGLRRESGFWRGLRATVSLRSVLRPLAPAPGARTRTTERGRRRFHAVRPTT